METMEKPMIRREEPFKVLLYDPDPINRGIVRAAIESQTDRMQVLVARALGEIVSLGQLHRPALLLWSIGRGRPGALYSVGSVRLLLRQIRIILLIDRITSDLQSVMRDFSIDRAISTDIALAELVADIDRVMRGEEEVRERRMESLLSVESDRRHSAILTGPSLAG